jgi:hypothetical protein
VQHPLNVCEQGDFQTLASYFSNAGKDYSLLSILQRLNYTFSQVQTIQIRVTKPCQKCDMWKR